MSDLEQGNKITEGEAPRRPRPEGEAPRRPRPEGEAPRRPRPEGEATRRLRPEGEETTRRLRPETGRNVDLEELEKEEQEEKRLDNRARERALERERQKKQDQERQRKFKKTAKIVGIVLKILLGIFFLLILATLAINGYMLLVERRKVVTVEEWSEQMREGETTDCILVLGCSVTSNQEPSVDLRGRLERTAELYRISPHKILVSGDHSQDGYYNEVKVMKDYLIQIGVPSSDIFVDHYGFSTYDSIYRAYHTFGVRKVTIVTQDFHIYRAIFLANSIGMESQGVASADRSGGGESVWSLREIFARDKDFLASLFWNEPEKTGDSISLDGDGDETNER